MVCFDMNGMVGRLATVATCFLLEETYGFAKSYQAHLKHGGALCFVAHDSLVVYDFSMLRVNVACSRVCSNKC